jgi:hypothetical protein
MTSTTKSEQTLDDAAKAVFILIILTCIDFFSIEKYYEEYPK